MGRYLLTRLLHTFVLLVVATLLSYLLLYLAPGDPAQVIAAQRLGGRPNATQVAWVRQHYVLDQPWFGQYCRWLSRALHGDFGYSIRTGQLILEEIRQAWHHSLTLGLWTIGLVMVLGGVSGVWAALRHHTLWDRLVQWGGLLCVSIPEFWLAFVLIWLFAIKLAWLPSYGAKSSAHLVLPVLSLALGQAARVSRVTRALMLAEMGQDYLRTAQAKGRTCTGALLRHGLPNIAVPFVTLLAHQASLVLSGAIIIETLFSWPGLGAYFITAVQFRDVPVIQAMVLLFTMLIVILYGLADLSYGWLDPRIRLQG